MTRLVPWVGALGIVGGLAGLPSCSQTTCDADCSQETVAGGGWIDGRGGQAGNSIGDPTSCGTANRPLEQLSPGSCTYGLGPLPTDDNRTGYDRISIFVDGAALVRDTSHTEGWDYTDAVPAAITMYGQVCADLTNGSLQTVSVSFVCLDV
jgi:hypothetical protein